MGAVKTLRSPKPALMSWLTPAITVRDVSKAMEFYEKAFGFEKGESMAGPEGAIVHGMMKYEGSIVVMLGREGSLGCKTKPPVSSRAECPVNLYVYCEDVDELFQRAQKAGAKVISQPADMFWGDRMAQFEDIDGYHWSFATNVADFDPSKAPK